MPSFTATAVSFILRTTGIYRRMFAGGEGAEKYWRKAQAAKIAPPKSIYNKCAVSSSTFGGRTIWEIAPKQASPSQTVLFWHGGGYIYPPSPAHWQYFAHMASMHGWRVIVPLYPLAPSADAQSIGTFAMDAYQHVTSTVDPGQLVMAGDSAGGGLTAITALRARDAGLALPAKLILICPWLDVVPDHVDQLAIAPRDALLTIRGITEAGAHFARDLSTDHPYVSPIHGDWSGLPPTLCFGGGDDILVTDSRALKAKVPHIQYDEQARMIHDWPLFFFPESRKAQMQMAAFVSSSQS